MKWLMQAAIFVAIGGVVLGLAWNFEPSWARDLDLIVAGANFGSAGWVAAEWIFQHKYEQREREDSERELQSFRAELEAARNEFLRSLMAQAAAEIERQTDGRVTLEVGHLGRRVPPTDLN